MSSASDKIAAWEHLAAAAERRSFLYDKMCQIETTQQTEVEYLKWMTDADLKAALVYATLAMVK